MLLVVPSWNSRVNRIIEENEGAKRESSGAAGLNLLSECIA